MSQDIREGEERLSFDPGDRVDAGLTFIGTIRSRWSKGNCPRNIRGARDSHQEARIELQPGYEAGLLGLSVGQAVIAVYWMDRSRRDLIIQNPGHTEEPKGTFALRSPVRPNPLAMSTVMITSLDPTSGIIGIDAIDVFDGTPLIDLKPWLETVDLPPERQR